MYGIMYYDSSLTKVLASYSRPYSSSRSVIKVVVLAGTSTGISTNTNTNTIAYCLLGN
jgi:hypothetical protein